MEEVKTTHAVVIDGNVIHFMCGKKGPVDFEAERVIPFDERSFGRMFAYVTCDACYCRVANRARRFGIMVPGEDYT